MSRTIDKQVQALAELVANETTDPNNPLVSTKQAAVRIAEELHRDLESMSSCCREGIVQCMQALNELAPKDDTIKIDSIVEEFSKASSQMDSSEKTQKAGLQLIDGQSWKEILNITDNTVKTLYKAASHIFNEEHYPEAVNAFMFLVTLDPSSYVYWLGLGHAAYHKKDYALAVNGYAMANVCNPDSVWPHIYAANAFEAQNDFPNALAALEDAKEFYSFVPNKDPEIEASINSRIGNLKNRV